MAALYDGDGNRLFTLDYVEDGKKSQKGQVLIPESAKTENGNSPAEQLADLVPKKNQEEYYSITQYVNDINRENTEILMELKTDGTANAAYTYGYSRNSRDTSDGASYYLYDGRGSVSGLTPADGVTTNSYQYDPYGNTIFGTPISINYYGYNAESTNTNTGYQYLRARYYNPVNGNFITEDTNTGTTENPLTRNRYGYVNNNPLNYEDPTGHSLWSKIKSAASKVVSTVKKVAKKVVTTVKNVAKKVVNTVKSAVNWVVNAVTHPKQTIQKAVEQAQTTYRNVKRAASSAGSNFVKSVSSGFQRAGRVFSSFTEYVSVKTSEIKATIKRELCTTANKITDALGKVDWKSVGIAVVATAAAVGVGVLTGGVGLAAAGALGLAQGSLGAAVVAGAVTGAIGGATYSGTESILSGDSAGEVITDTLTGAGTGLLSGGAFGALGYGANKLVNGIKSVVNSGSSNAGSVATDNKVTSTIADTIDDTDEIKNFSDLMSSEDAARYNKYWDTQETIAKQKQQINEFEEGIKKGVQYSNKQKGNYGEMKMDQYYENLGFERVSSSTVTSLDDPIHHGIDGVYKNKTTGEFIVAEAKYNSGRLNTKTGQMGEKWISKNINDAVNESTVKALQNQGYTSNLYNIKADGSIRFDALDSRAKVIPDL